MYPAGVRTQVAKDEELSWNDYIPINLPPVPKYFLSEPTLPTVNRLNGEPSTQVLGVGNLQAWLPHFQALSSEG